MLQFEPFQSLEHRSSISRYIVTNLLQFIISSIDTIDSKHEHKYTNKIYFHKKLKPPNHREIQENIFSHPQALSYIIESICFSFTFYGFFFLKTSSKVKVLVILKSILSMSSYLIQILIFHLD